MFNKELFNENGKPIVVCFVKKKKNKERSVNSVAREKFLQNKLLSPFLGFPIFSSSF